MVDGHYTVMIAVHPAPGKTHDRRSVVRFATDRHSSATRCWRVTTRSIFSARALSDDVLSTHTPCVVPHRGAFMRAYRRWRQFSSGGCVLASRRERIAAYSVWTKR